MRARDLFTAMWTPDLFMKRIKENGDWSLFCPNEALVFQIVGELSLKLSTRATKKKERRENKLRRRISGLQFLNHKLKQEILICSIRMRQMEKATNKI